MYELLLQEGAKKAKAGQATGRMITKSSSSAAPAPDHDVVLEHDEPNTHANSDDEFDVEFYKVVN